MKNTSKKGFTIVELVIVIAIIAILAAVLIPTFVSVIKRANESADIQAVRQMNTYLAINEALEGKTIYDALKALEEGGMDADNYKPLTEGRYFFWDSGANRVVYVEYNETSKEYDILFPENQTKQGQWFSLTSEIKKEAYASPTVSGSTTTVSISSGEQLAQLVSDLKDISEGRTGIIENFTSSTVESTIKCLTGNIIIELTEDIDFGGASFNINLNNASFTLKGNGHKLSGICNASGFAESANNEAHSTSQYGAGIVGYAYNSEITFDNIIIENSFFGKSDVKAAAIFVGMISHCNVAFNNTSAVNCDVKGEKGVAVYIGHSRNVASSTTKTIMFTGTNTANDCSVEAYSANPTNLIAIITGRVTTTVANCAITLSGIPSVTNTTLISNNTKLASNPWYIQGNKAGAAAVTEYDGTAVTFNNGNTTH